MLLQFALSGNYVLHRYSTEFVDGFSRMKNNFMMIKNLFFGLMTLLLALNVNAQNWKVGNSYFDKDKWVEFIPGNMPLVIGVPHGGDMMPEGIPDRSCPGVVNATDGRTINLARAIIDVFQKNYGCQPSIIICHLKRLKVDVNREIEIATCGNEEMKVPWRFWHEMIDTALASAVKKYGQSLYIDLHGQGHPNKRLELGYLLDNEQLQTSNKSSTDTVYTSQSSLHNLINASKGKLNLKDLLTGPNSFGTWMAESGFPATPSMQDPFPLPKEKYFPGGFNEARFTSKPNVFGWQIESNNVGVRDNMTSCYAFAEAFTKNIMRFISTYTSIDVKKIGK